MMRALTMLNESGDTTISWSPDRDEEMQRIVEKKMSEGVTFFIVDRAHDCVRMKLDDAAKANEYRSLAIPDEDLAKFVSSGSGEATPTPSGKVTKSRVSRSAKEVASSTSVGVKPRKGG